MVKPNRPVLRYYGGKWRIAPWVVGHFPKHRVYVEPFGGAASVLMRKPRSYAEVYNDLDSAVVNLFQVLRDSVQAEELERQIRLTPFARDEFLGAYEESDNPIEQARRMVVRSFMAHGSSGACRNSRSGFRGDCNRPGGTPAHDWQTWPDCIAQITQRLAGVVIENRDYADVINRYAAPDTLIYVEPPYMARTRGSFGVYRHELTDTQHAEMAALLQATDAMVIMSGYSSGEYAEWFTDWQCVTMQSHTDARIKRTECLWLNPAAQAELPQLSLLMGG